MSEKEGFWVPHTSTIDWCELNYEVSHYIAEFFNSTSALLFFLLTLGLWFDAAYRRHNLFRLPTRYLCNYAWLALVALGSALFHATLKYEMQLLDELPMLYGMAQGFYCALPEPSGIWAVMLIGVNAAFTLHYLWARDAFWHEIMFALSTTLLVLAYLRQALSLLKSDDKKSIKIKGAKQALWILGKGLTMVLTGFAFWLWENGNCGVLTDYKSFLGMPAALALEFHALWHLLSYAGVLYLQTGLVVLHLTSQGRPCRTFGPMILPLPLSIKKE